MSYEEGISQTERRFSADDEPTEIADLVLFAGGASHSGTSCVFSVFPGSETGLNRSSRSGAKGLESEGLLGEPSRRLRVGGVVADHDACC